MISNREPSAAALPGCHRSLFSRQGERNPRLHHSPPQVFQAWECVRRALPRDDEEIVGCNQSLIPMTIGMIRIRRWVSQGRSLIPMAMKDETDQVAMRAALTKWEENAATDWEDVLVME